MKRIVLIFGLLSGLISSVMMSVSLPLTNRGVISFDNAEVIGYTSLFLSFLLVFFGIRSYRDNHGGTVTFGRAFKVGILITLVSCACYVITWQVIYFRFTPDFIDKLSAATVASMQAKGASEAAIARKRAEMEDIHKLEDNPLTNAAVTLIEPLPVGLLMTLVSAAILRRRGAAA